MKRFTVKDFISYGATCIGCGKKVLFRLEKTDHNEGEFTNIPIHVKDNYIEAMLVIKYSVSLCVRIYPKTNRFEVSDVDKFVTYLGIYDLNLAYRCRPCNSVIISEPMQFDSKGFIKPISLYLESFLIKENIADKVRHYSVFTAFKEDNTQISIYTDAPQSFVAKDLDKMTIPLFPIYKFKTRENFLKKIKTYITFS